MLKEAEGIVLHSIKYGDNGRIVHVYTDTEGLMSYIVQGFSSKSSFKKIYFQSLNVLKLNFYHKQKSSLHRIKEVKILDLTPLDYNMNKMSVQMFISELLYNSIKEEEANPHLYDFLKNWIIDFRSAEIFDPNIHLQFMLELSKYLGFFPNSQLIHESATFDLEEGIFKVSQPTESSLSPSHSLLFLRLLKKEDNFSNSERRVLMGILLEYYRFHLHNFKEIKSKSVLEAVFS